MRTNEFWPGAILNALQRGDDPRALMTWDERNDTLSALEVQAMARLVFADDSNFVKLVMLPEEPETHESQHPSGPSEAQP